MIEDQDQDQELELDEDEKCVICGGSLDLELTCKRCLQDLSTEKFNEALERCLQDVSVVEILYTVPGLYELIREEYNNEALDQAYNNLVDEHDRKEITRERLSMLGVK